MSTLRVALFLNFKLLHYIYRGPQYHYSSTKYLKHSARDQSRSRYARFPSHSHRGLLFELLSSHIHDGKRFMKSRAETHMLLTQVSCPIRPMSRLDKSFCSRSSCDRCMSPAGVLFVKTSTPFETSVPDSTDPAELDQTGNSIAECRAFAF